MFKLFEYTDENGRTWHTVKMTGPGATKFIDIEYADKKQAQKRLNYLRTSKPLGSK